MINFDDFWNKYNCKKNKKSAKKAWDRLNNENKQQAYNLINAFMDSLQDWQSPPYPATYLNGERWTDDLTPAKKEIKTTLPPDEKLPQWARDNGFRQARPGESWYQYKNYLNKQLTCI